MNAFFFKFARATSNLVAHPFMFLLAVLSVVAWAALGPVLHFSEGWQLWINTVTTILTFLMVFLLQHTQNHDTRAVHVKLNELLRALAEARTEMVDLENVSDEELAKYCEEFKILHNKAAALLERKGKARRTRAS